MTTFRVAALSLNRLPGRPNSHLMFDIFATYRIPAMATYMTLYELYDYYTVYKNGNMHNLSN